MIPMLKNRTILFIVFMMAFIPCFSQTDEDCLACHEDPELKKEDGESLFVNHEKFLSSVHGKVKISCIGCHSDLEGFEDFPHPEKLQAVRCGLCHNAEQEEFQKSRHGQTTPERDCCAVSCKDCHGKHDIKRKDNPESRIFPLNLPRTCERCHLDKVKTENGREFVKQYEKSIHFRGLEKLGLATSSNCSNCHGAHDVKSVHDPLSRVSRRNIIRTCGKCHIGIEKDYLEGVHGKDYLKGIKDVPVCTDCHKEHDITSPQDLNSPVYATKVANVCSRCHDDQTLARTYGFLTSRLKTYSESFHGTASKFGETRVANCASCHGFHDIRPSSDPQSSIYSDNLPQTCGKCHPGASKHFAEGQIHYIPKEIITPKYKAPLFVKTIYIILITVIISVFILFITADLSHRLIKRWKK